MRPQSANFKSIMTLALLPLASVSPDSQLPIDKDARLTLGVSATYNATAYQADNNISFFPVGSYDNNRLYIEGAEAGFYPYKDSNDQVRIGLSYDGREFNPKDANVAAMKDLDKRDWSVLAHASYMHITPYGGFKIKATTDVLSRHDGQTVSLSHLSKFTKDKLTVYPEFGAVWQSKDYNQYYFGVSADESGRTGVDRYDAESGVMPFVAATATYKINDRISVFGNQRVEWLSSTQKDSPLADGSVDSKTRLGVNYTF